MADEQTEYDAAAMENVRQFVAKALQKGEPKPTITQNLTEMGMDPEQAGLFVDQVEGELAAAGAAAPGPFSFKTAMPAVIAGALGAAAGGLVWGLLALYASIQVGYAALLVGVLAGFGVAAYATSRVIMYQGLAAVLALFGLIIGKGLALLRFSVGETFGIIDIVFLFVALGAAWGLPAGLGGRINAGSAAATPSRRPTIVAIVCILVSAALLGLSIFPAWQHWRIEETTANEGLVVATFDWGLQDTTHVVESERGEDGFATYSYDDAASPIEDTSIGLVMKVGFAFALLGLFLAVIGLALYAAPFFGVRVGTAYRMGAMVVALLVAGCAVAGPMAVYFGFPKAIGKDIPNDAPSYIDAETNEEVSASSHFFGGPVEDASTGSAREWGPGGGWFLAFLAGATSLVAAGVPWSSRHLFGQEKAAAAEEAPAQDWGPAEAPGMEAPALEAAPATVEGVAEPEPMPAAESTELSANEPIKLRCPDCTTIFDMVPMARPFDIVCPSCTRTTTLG